MLFVPSFISSAARVRLRRDASATPCPSARSPGSICRHRTPSGFENVIAAAARRSRALAFALSLILSVAFLVGFPLPGRSAEATDPTFINFETAPVHPVDLSPDGTRLAICNLADGRLELFDLPAPSVPGGATPLPVPAGDVPVGIDPVAVRFRTATEAWVVNHVSDSISVVDIPSRRVIDTIPTLDTPSDVVFAGEPIRAFVSCARPNRIQVFDAGTRQWITNLTVDAERPRSLAVSPDGRTVYAAIFESGNATTVIGGTFANGLFFDNVVGLSNSPSGGRNPAPNAGTNFSPALNAALPAQPPPPGSGLIVRRNEAGRWLDANQGDWTEFVTGTNAHLTHRVPGWDLPDRDIAHLDTTTFELSYTRGLMNLCMAIAVQPGSGRLTVVGTEARNDIRFEPNLNGVFVEVRLALVDPDPPAPGQPPSRVVRDLNPHLDYRTSTIPAIDRDRSVGDPRAIVWTPDGARAYVAGMGSRNLVVLDAAGRRLDRPPIEVGEGPCGLALDGARRRLYVFNRFSSSLSVIDTDTDTVVGAMALFDPTPFPTAVGRRHLYDTRRTSGLGQASCASCHVDVRMDRLAWDLGNPAGALSTQVLNQQGTLVTNVFHPMKGVMLTQTLQDIIGHEPFHWRGDKPDIESFNPAYTNLQGAPAALSATELRELRDFLASVRLPPNPFRELDNSLPTALPLPGEFATGSGPLPAGTPLPPGNAAAGVTAFTRAANFCQSCHSLPTGLGLDAVLDGGTFKPIPAGPNDARHFPVAFRLEGPLRSKIAPFRNLGDRLGMDTGRPASRAGFGFGHDGSVDTLPRFLNGVRVVDDQEIADLIALLLSVSGADLATPGAVPDLTPPAAVGRQFTIASPVRPAMFDAFLALARSATSRVDVIARGRVGNLPRGWWFDRSQDRFQSDRQGESHSPAELIALAGPGAELTFTAVARGTGRRLGIDRDLDGRLNRDELDAGTDPADRLLRPRVTAVRADVPVGLDLRLESQLPPLPAPGVISWWKDGQLLPGETNAVLAREGVSLAAAGQYTVHVTTPFQTLSSLPLTVRVVPLQVVVQPESQMVRQGSNAIWQASLTGLGPFTHQWRFNGQDLPNATGSNLIVTAAQLAQEGLYQVVAANAHGSATSAPVRLGLLINPGVVIPPVSLTVPEGGDVTFSAQISGHPAPFGYSLRRSATILTNLVSDERSVFLPLRGVTAGAAGTYRIVVTNAANPSPGLTLGPISLTVLADSDRDGLPDAWEAARGLATNDPADAAFDPDGDGLTTASEYLAGTDPFDPLNALRFLPPGSLPGNGDGVVLQFLAVSNRTYTIQHRDGLPGALNPPGAGWQRTADFVAAATNRTITLSLTNHADTPLRYYRLATPRLP